MIYVLTGMSVLFIGIGFTVTENNAAYLLAGYNTMTEEERKNFDLKSYIIYFRKFHLFLGLSFLVIGLIIHYLMSENAGGIFLGVYPILAYLYFVLRTAKYTNGSRTKWHKAGVYIMLGALILVLGVFGLGYQENKLVITAGNIKLEGIYGEELNLAAIQSVALVNELPKITLRTNGFAAGTVSKGYFRTQAGENIKLLINADNQPYLLITKKSGGKIYFSAKSNSNEKIYHELKKALPTVGYQL